MVACPGGASLHIKQPLVHAIAEAPGHAGKPVGPGGERFAAERAYFAAIDIGSRPRPLDAQYPVVRKLVVATNLTTAKKPGDACSCSIPNDAREIIAPRLIAKFLIAYAKTNMSANVTSRPTESRLRRCLEQTEIGRLAWCTSNQRDNRHPGKQQLFSHISPHTSDREKSTCLAYLNE